MKQLSNFDLTILLSCSGWSEASGVVFRSNAKQYERNGIEVIIMVESPALEARILECVRPFPFVAWRVMLNEKGCGSSEVAASFHAGIRFAEREYCLVMEPDVEIRTDVIYLLREKLDFYPGHYAFGQVQGEPGKTGGLMARTADFRRISAEFLPSGKPEIETMRLQLEQAGLRPLFFPEAVSSRKQRQPEVSVGSLPDRTPLYNKVYTTVYHWKENPYAREQCDRYLSTFKQYEYLSDDIFRRSYSLVALIPAYNESERIAGCLQNAEQFCDGIILLDDDSPDDTYRLARSEKLLIKARKIRNRFDDKQNRNILLDIASFVKADWFIFVDADERFDARFFDLDTVVRLPVESVGVWIANLWDSPDTYRTDLEDTNAASRNGLWFRWRMFRNQGRMQIFSPHSLHFTTLPYISRTHAFKSATVLLHLGYLDKSKRDQKYSFYKKEDTAEIMNYDYILYESYRLARVKDIEIDSQNKEV